MSGNSVYKNPKFWEVVKLGAFVESAKGKKPRSQVVEKSESHSLPYVDIQAFEEGIVGSWTDGEGCQICHESDFLMVWDGSRSGLVGKGMKGVLGSTLVRINFPSMENQYAYYFLQSKYQQINTRAKGSGTPHVDPDLLWNYDFPIPPLNEQQRIVAKIEELFFELDKGVESLKTARAKLNVYRQSVLKHAFEGKLTAQDPNDEPASELLKRIAAEKARRVKQGVLREQKSLPPINDEDAEFDLEGWQWVRMAEVIKLWNGFAFKSDDFQSEGIPVIRIGDLKNGEVSLSDAVCVSDAVSKTVGTEVWIPPNALLIAMSGATTGKTAFNRTGTPLLLNQRVGRVEVFSVSVRFIRFFFETAVARNLSISRGTAIPNLSTQQINETVIAIPPLAEQHRIVVKIEEQLSVLEELDKTLDQQLSKAAVLRQSILKKAFSGQLVAQDPNDEPASVFLDRIKAEKKQGRKSGETTRQTRKKRTTA